MDPNYDPKNHKLMTFHDAIAKFRDGSDTPARIWNAAWKE